MISLVNQDGVTIDILASAVRFRFLSGCSNSKGHSCVCCLLSVTASSSSLVRLAVSDDILSDEIADVLASVSEEIESDEIESEELHCYTATCDRFAKHNLFHKMKKPHARHIQPLHHVMSFANRAYARCSHERSERPY